MSKVLQQRMPPLNSYNHKYESLLLKILDFLRYILYKFFYSMLVVQGLYLAEVVPPHATVPTRHFSHNLCRPPHSRKYETRRSC